MVSLSEAPNYIWAFVLVGIIAAVGVLVLSEFETSLTTGYETAATGNATLGIAKIAQQLPTVGIVVGVSLIIMVVVGLLVYFGRGEGQTF